MPIAAIVLDDWKLETFRRILTEAGYTYTEHEGVTPETVTLKVKAENMTMLGEVVKVCNSTAEELRRKLQ